MDEDLEYNFLKNQIHANEQIRSILQHEISTLMALIHQKRQWLNQLDEIDKQINLRIQAIGENDKALVKHSLASNW